MTTSQAITRRTLRQSYQARGYCSCGRNRDNPARRLCLDCRQQGAANAYTYRARHKRTQQDKE